MPVPSPASTATPMGGWCPHSGRRSPRWWRARWRSEKLAPPPSELVMPGTAIAAPSTALARSTSESRGGLVGSSMSRSGWSAPASRAGRGRRTGLRARALPSPRHARAGRRAAGEKSVEETNATRLPRKTRRPRSDAFGAFDIFELAEAVGHAGRDVFDDERVGGIGAGFLGRGDQAVQKVLRVGLFGRVHGPYLASLGLVGKRQTLVRHVSGGLNLPPRRRHTALRLHRRCRDAGGSARPCPATPRRCRCR